ncbi:MAG: ROK family protein [Wenzhouxiangellaceae bacterium]|nr:ROK family protein [Wenzhouxiangellaceae bacterium]
MQHTRERLIGGIEAGGTKFNCVLARSPERVLARATLATTRPEQTLAEVGAFFAQQAREHGTPEAIGLASFGPVELNRGASNFGHITNTPKPDWSDIPIVRTLARELGVPVAFETDVNGAALGEGFGCGAAAGLEHYAYVTIGTGIGAGLISNGRPIQGFSHPEVGHMRVPRHPDDQFSGRCPFHGDCLEGLACGPALADRWSVDPGGLPADHPAWAIEAHYLAALCWNLTCLFAPQRIILGGGVMQADGLLDRVRADFEALSGDYFQALESAAAHPYLARPGHGGRSGEIGALLLAERLLANKREHGGQGQ